MMGSVWYCKQNETEPVVQDAEGRDIEAECQGDMAYSSQGSGGATWKRQSVMTAKKKRQNRVSMATSVRTVQWYCGKTHKRDVWGVGVQRKPENVTLGFPMTVVSLSTVKTEKWMTRVHAMLTIASLLSLAGVNKVRLMGLSLTTPKELDVARWHNGWWYMN